MATAELQPAFLAVSVRGTPRAMQHETYDFDGALLHDLTPT